MKRSRPILTSLIPQPGLLLTLAVFCGLLCPGLALAQRNVNANRFRPAMDAQSFITLQAARTPGHLNYDMGLSYDWSLGSIRGPNVDESRVTLVNHRMDLHPTLQVGVFSRLAVGVTLPVTVYQKTRLTNDGDGDIPEQAFGDPRLLARYQLFGEPSSQDPLRSDGGALAAQAEVTLPAGPEDSFTSERGVTSTLRAIADFHLLGLAVGASLGYLHRFVPHTALDRRFRDELQFTAGLQIPVPVMTRLFVLGEFQAETDAGAPFHNGRNTALETRFGGRVHVEDFALSTGLGLGINRQIGVPDARLWFGLQWSPRVKDADGDGIPDGQDECQFLPEDFDGFEDADGCLDPDNDGDLIPDLDDRCPLEAAEDFRDEDEDGCTDEGPPAATTEPALPVTRDEEKTKQEEAPSASGTSEDERTDEADDEDDSDEDDDTDEADDEDDSDEDDDTDEADDEDDSDEDD